MRETRFDVKSRGKRRGRRRRRSRRIELNRKCDGDFEWFGVMNVEICNPS